MMVSVTCAAEAFDYRLHDESNTSAAMLSEWRVESFERLQNTIGALGMSNDKWDEKVSEADRRDQLKLIYDYIKFHIGLYIGTPAAMSIIADGLGVKTSRYFTAGLLVAITIYIVAVSRVLMQVRS